MKKLIISLLLLSLNYTAHATTQCEISIALVTNAMGNNIRPMLSLADDINSQSIEDISIKSTKDLEYLLNAARELQKLKYVKVKLAEKNHRRCKSFDKLFNKHFMDAIINMEFRDFKEHIDFEDRHAFIDAFSGGDIIETPYYGLRTYDHTIEFVEKAADKILSNELLFRENIKARFAKKAIELQEVNNQASSLEEKIKEEEALERQLAAAKEKKRQLAKNLEIKKAQRRNVESKSKVVVIGIWYDDLGSPDYLDATLSIYIKNNSYFLGRVNGDKSKGSYRLQLLGDKYVKNDKFGAYYKIVRGDLHIYDKNGFIRIARLVR